MTVRERNNRSRMHNVNCENVQDELQLREDNGRTIHRVLKLYYEVCLLTFADFVHLRLRIPDTPRLLGDSPDFIEASLFPSLLHYTNYLH